MSTETLIRFFLELVAICILTFCILHEDKFIKFENNLIKHIKKTNKTKSQKKPSAKADTKRFSIERNYLNGEFKLSDGNTYFITYFDNRGTEFIINECTNHAYAVVECDEYNYIIVRNITDEEAWALHMKNH